MMSFLKCIDCGIGFKEYYCEACRLTFRGFCGACHPCASKNLH